MSSVLLERVRSCVVRTCVATLIFGSTVHAAEANRPPSRKYSNLERLALPRLQAVHDDVQNLKARRVEVAPRIGLQDYRCILHAHAEDSAHTGGTLAEMLADAKKAGISAILLTDHFRPPRDFIEGRPRGLKEGVLFLPGSEIRGFLIYPLASILNKMEQPGPEFIRTVTVGDGMIFLSHVEERPDYPVAGLTGLEIYNRHWDAKRDLASLLALAFKLTDPKQLAEMEEALRLYPDELLAFQCDYPQVYLDKWDAGTRVQRLTGVAANDCLEQIVTGPNPLIRSQHELCLSDDAAIGEVVRSGHRRREVDDDRSGRQRRTNVDVADRDATWEVEYSNGVGDRSCCQIDHHRGVAERASIDAIGDLRRFSCSSERRQKRIALR